MIGNRYYRFNGDDWDEIYNLKISRIYDNDRFTHQAKYEIFIDNSLWKPISYLNLNEYRIKDVFRNSKPIIENVILKEESKKPIHNTKRISWKDDTDFKYYLSYDSSTIFKINKYKIFINKFDNIEIEFVCYQSRHNWTNKKLEHPFWQVMWESIEDFDTIENFIHNRIFDSFYQANQKKLELNPPLTKQQLEENQVRLNWDMRRRDELHKESGWNWDELGFFVR